MDFVKVIMDVINTFVKLLDFQLNSVKSTTFFCAVDNAVKERIISLTSFAPRLLLVRYLGVPLLSARFFTLNCSQLVD